MKIVPSEHTRGQVPVTRPLNRSHKATTITSCGQVPRLRHVPSIQTSLNPWDKWQGPNFGIYNYFFDKNGSSHEGLIAGTCHLVCHDFYC